MGKDRLEDYFKDKLQSHEEYLDKDQLWKDLGLEKKKRKRGFIYWFLGTLSIIGIAAVLYLISNDSTNNQTPSLAINKNQNHSNSIHSVDNQTSSIDHTITQNPQPIPNSNQSSSSTPQNDGIKSNISINQTKSSTTSKIQNVITSEESTKTQSESTDLSTEETIVWNNTLQPMHIEEVKDMRALSKIEAIPSSFLDIPIEEFGMSLTNTDISNILPQPSPTRWSAWIEAEAGLYNKTFENKVNGERLLDYKTSKISSLEYIGFGIGTKYYLNSNIYLGAGLQYGQWSESMNHVSQKTQIITDTIPEEVYINYAGDTLNRGLKIVEGTQNIVTTSKYYNYHRSLSIPLLIGYNYKIRNWGIQGEIGLLTHFRSTFSGHTIDNELSLVNQNSTVYRNRWNQSLRFGIGAKYNLSNRHSFYGMLRYQYGLRSITNANYDLEEFLRTTAVSFGYEYRF